MTQYPAAYIAFRVYEDSINEVGVANVTLPDITNKAVTIMGSGMMGEVSVPIMGMIENMTMSMKFLSHASPGTFSMFLEQRKHQIELRVAEEYWDIEDAEIGMWPNKYVMIARPKSMKSGTIAPPPPPTPPESSTCTCTPPTATAKSSGTSISAT